MKTGLVIGAGPAGLMAADILSAAGVSVTLADQMPSPARKFLMAGKSGLNLTKEGDDFADAYGNMSPALSAAISAFGPGEVKAWAEELGQPLFTGSTGRVFPTVMKASPLLRAWLRRLDAQGVLLRTRWKWVGWDDQGVRFETPKGIERIRPDVTIMAVGGASWQRLGSDGEWQQHLQEVSPFRPANMGLNVNWSPHMTPYLGKPVKGVRLTAGDMTSRGEFIVSARGIEGGGVYEVSSAVRDGAALNIDLLPDRSLLDVRTALARPHGKSSMSNHLRKVLRLDAIRIALLNEWARPFPDDLALAVKKLRVAHAGPRPLDEAISTAGGLRFDALDDGLMFFSRPGTFAAGEMLDWEAPTGGYLITACLATGAHAARSALRYMNTALPAA